MRGLLVKPEEGHWRTIDGIVCATMAIARRQEIADDFKSEAAAGVGVRAW